MDYTSYVNAWIAYQKQARWTEAEAALKKAKALLPAPSKPEPELAPGQVLSHRDIRGQVTAVCLYQGPRDFVYAERSYPTLAAAAVAASEALGLRLKRPIARVFWGLEKRDDVIDGKTASR